MAAAYVYVHIPQAKVACFSMTPVFADAWFSLFSLKNISDWFVELEFPINNSFSVCWWDFYILIEHNLEMTAPKFMLSLAIQEGNLWILLWC